MRRRPNRVSSVMERHESEGPDAELTRFDSLAVKCIAIEDVVAAIGEPAEVSRFAAPSATVQHRFRGSFRHFVVVVQDHGAGPLTFIAEPVSECVD